MCIRDRLYTLRAACCVDHHQLTVFDDHLRSGLSSICNVSLTDDQWLQASLPVRNGGLELRRVSSLASSAFLAFAAGTRRLQELILHRVKSCNDDVYESCLMIRAGSRLASPDDSDAHKQRLWDKAVVDAEFSQLFNKYTAPNHRARLLAAVAPHSGDWLHTVPIR